MKLIKKDLVDIIFKNYYTGRYTTNNLRKQDIQNVIDYLIETLAQELLAGNSIELRGLGSFERKFKKAREYAFNPRTRKCVQEKDHYTTVFHLGKKLRNLMRKVEISEEDKPSKYERRYDI